MMSPESSDTPFPWPRVHRLAAAFAAIAIVRFAGALSTAIPLGDEVPYLEAMTFLGEGRSPYSGFGYFYPPAFAVLGRSLLDAVGPTGVLVVLRLVNLIGAAYLIACSVVFLGGSNLRRWIVGAAVLCLSPAVALAFDWGNLSLAIAGLAVVALIDWPRRPWRTALGLSVATAIKPMTAVALVILPVAELVRRGRHARLAPWAGAALLQLAALVLGAPHLRDFLGQDGGWPTATRSVALQRLAHLAGFEVSATVILALVTALATGLTIWLVHERRLRVIGIVALAIGASLWATPVIWSHTLLLCLPLQAIAVERALERWRLAGNAPGGRTPWRRWEPAFVVLAVLALHLVEGIGGIELAPAPILIAATLAVHAALATVVVLAAGARPTAQR